MCCSPVLVLFLNESEQRQFKSNLTALTCSSHRAVAVVLQKVTLRWNRREWLRWDLDGPRFKAPAVLFCAWFSQVFRCSAALNAKHKRAEHQDTWKCITTKFRSKRGSLARNFKRAGLKTTLLFILLEGWGGTTTLCKESIKHLIWVDHADN